MAVVIEQVGAWNGKSIPTFYNAVTFRSRLEARWAVFMDHLGVPWSYEHEGYALDSGWYVPDFWLPTLQTHLEIKPSVFSPSADSQVENLCGELALQTKRRVVLFLGSPAEQGPILNGDPYRPASSHETGTVFVHCSPPQYDPDIPESHSYRYGWGSDQPYLWCKCPGCGKFGIEFDGRGARVCGKPTGGDGPHLPNQCIRLSGEQIGHPDKAYSWDDPLIFEAAETSKAWRFH